MAPSHSGCRGGGGARQGGFQNARQTRRVAAGRQRRRQPTTRRGSYSDMELLWDAQGLNYCFGMDGEIILFPAFGFEPAQCFVREN